LLNYSNLFWGPLFIQTKHTCYLVTSQERLHQNRTPHFRPSPKNRLDFFCNRTYRATKEAPLKQLLSVTVTCYH